MISMTQRVLALNLLFASAIASGCGDADANLDRDLDTVAAEHGLNGWLLVRVDETSVLDRPLAGLSDSLPRPGISTPLHIASLSKLLTEVAVLRLVDDGRLDLDRTLASYRPGFQPGFGDSVSVAQLMDMRSGLPRELDPDGLFKASLLDTAGFAGPYLDAIPTLPRATAEADVNGYSNVDFWLLGAVIEAVADAPLQDALRTLVLDPLDLQTTGYRDGAPHAMPGYDLSADGFVEVREDLSLRYASGGYVASVEDLHRLGEALLSPGFLEEESWRRLFGEGAVPERLEIFGALPGHAHMLMIDPTERLVATAVNNVTPRDLNGMIRLRDRVLTHVGIDATETSRARRTVTVQPLDELSVDAPLERCLKDWVPKLESGDAAAIHAGIAECGPTGAFEAGDPTWQEYVRIRSEAESFAVAGWRRVEEGAPRGIEVWIDFGDDGKLALLLIPSEADPTLVENLMVQPDDLTWMGHGY